MTSPHVNSEHMGLEPTLSEVLSTSSPSPGPPDQQEGCDDCLPQEATVLGSVSPLAGLVSSQHFLHRACLLITLSGTLGLY